MKTLKKILCLLLCVILLAGCISPGGGQILKPDPESEDQTGNEPCAEDAEKQDSERKSGPPPIYSVGNTVPLSAEEPVIGPDHEDNFVSVKDADPGFTIRVTAPAGYSAETVLQGILFKNLSHPMLTDPNETDLIGPDRLAVEAGGGIFSVHCINGFHEGDAYQLELLDAALSFEGQDPAVRFYNLTIAAKEVFRMKLDEDVKFLSAEELQDADAGRALSLDGMFRYDASSGALAATGGSGSFTYEAGAYQAGDVVAVYEGVRPDERSFADADASVAYTKITAVTDAGNGQSLYQYVGAEQEDVLFVPDVIPVHQECLLTAGMEDSVSLESRDLRFTADNVFSGMRLDENTEVEPGDYLAFYTGTPEDGEVTAYAEILEVTHQEEDGAETTDISYRVVTLDEMMSSIDAYRYTSLTEAQIRDSYNEDAIKQEVTQTLTNNGYLLQSSYSLAEIALDTDEAKELFGETPLDQLTFYYGPDEAYTMSGQAYEMAAKGTAVNGVEVKADRLDIAVTPNIVHFAGKMGYGMGLRLEANAKFHITIRGADALKAALKVDITFFFETEVVMGYTLDATSVWKWKWIFPYIDDYTISGSCANGIYIGTGVAASATLIKNEKEKTEEELAAGIAWPDGVERTGGSEKVMAMANYIKDLSGKHDAIFPPQTTGGGDLSAKYTSFIKGADRSFVDLLNPNIFDWNGCIDPFHIIAFRIKADFIVSAQFNAAIGISANYERAYRQIFSFSLFHKTSEGTQIEETDNSLFRADVYIFGAIGLRAGLRLTVGVGLFDARLDSVGLIIEGGLYTRFWGYFYAGVEIQDVGRKNQKNDMYYSGGLLSEAGAYYTVSFFAQAGDGAISYQKIIAGDEYPFLEVGLKSIVSNFAYQQGDKDGELSAHYTKDIDAVELPASLFDMTVMSIKDGEVTAQSFGGQNALINYDIRIDDPNFAYTYQNGKHLLVRRDNSTHGEGTLQMTVSWKGRSFEQLSTDLYRTFEIPWEADQVTLRFLDREGDVFYSLTEAKGTPLTDSDFPQDVPESEGYQFLNWVDPEGETLTEWPKEMPEEDAVYTSAWYRLHVDAQVEYYMPYDHDEAGHVKYYLDDTDTISGLFYPGDPVADAARMLEENHFLRTKEDHVLEGKKWYEHYKVNEEDSELSVDKVAKDGTTVFRICLEWDACTITFDYGDGRTTSIRVLPGMPIEFPEATRQGYRFDGWQDAEGHIVDGTVYCTEDAVYTAVWELIPPTLTVEEQIKVKSWGATYYWQTVVSQVLVLDHYEVSVQELLDLVGIPEGYEYSPDASGREVTDVITIAEDGTTKVILRMKELQ